MKKIVLLGLLGFFLATMLACQNQTTTFPNPNQDYCVLSSNPDYYKCDIAWTSYFDTKIALTYYAARNDDVDAVFETVTEYLVEYHELFDKYNAHQDVVGIYAINQNADTLTSTNPLRYGEATISSNLFAAIEFALDHEDEVKSNAVSLFNIALGPVLEIWHNLRDQDECDEFIRFGSTVCPIPAANLFDQPFEVDPANIVLDETASTIGFLVPGMRLDLGGFGKGYVAELITDYLDLLNARYIFNAGASNVKAGGINPNSTDGFYNVALSTPIIGLSTGNSFYAIVKIGADVSIVTSGTYQRYFIGQEDDRVYHHLIDPRTNYPGGDTMSVSVLFEDGGLADIYSTAVFLLGLEAGQTFVNETPGLEAIWYLEDGTIIHSDGLDRGVFTYNASSYPLFTLK
jgi:FAD:protein FMN transferase